ncbi:MAG: molybdenum ABC transporter permease subunit [Tepidiforma sp.]|jgi:molybdate transport system permease protein|uniref:Molybdenum transport system permease n=1 Tax=Tepidiforma bonchosmolovskayae TaxID=2601677 RepID=A0ABX6C1F8_9CHLR|nr:MULTISPECIES: molybdate ABC transporter permease subunit [Tepidiforma]QFG01849.1 molybdate ABC transporter permease subunit [Tepidiforma bonchosmolovskayae]GIW15705.1 MAG: molybdenum ABC transporter permease subunit [Tepidiforma sp.]
MDAWADPLRISLLVAASATAVCVAVGTPLAWLIARARPPVAQVLSAISLLPLVLPPTAVGYYLLWLLGRQSPTGRFLLDGLGIQLVFTWPGAALAAAVVSLPLYVRTATAGFEQLDEELLLAGRTLAGPWRVFFLVVVPLAWPSLVAASLIAFARALGEFGATVVVASSIPGRTRTLPAAIYDANLAGDDRLANELSLVALLIGFVLVTLLTVALHAAVQRGRG